MEFNCKPFLLGMAVGIIVPYVPYITSQRGMMMKDKMVNKMSKVKDSIMEMVQDAAHKTSSNMDGVLESINAKIDDLSKMIAKMDHSKVKTKSKTSNE